MTHTDEKKTAPITDAPAPEGTGASAMTDFDTFAFSGPEWTPDTPAPPAPDAHSMADFDAFAFSGPQWQPEDDTAVPPPDDSSVLPLPADGQDNSPVKADSTAEDDKKTDEGGAPMSLMDHLNEMRFRLVRCAIAVGLGFLACWGGVEYLFDVLVAPLLAALPEGSHAQYLSLPEAFFTRMYIAFVAGVFAVSPYIFYQIWAFIAPGLYDEEKRYVIPIAVLSALFFIGGGAFCYFIVFPYAFNFFVSFATAEIVVMPKISDYLGFVLKLLMAFGLIFEMPLFALFLSHMGIISAASMRRVRRYAILVIFIVAAILTPPDVVSQLLMAGPMLILYEFSILVAAAFGRKKKTEVASNDQENTDKTAGVA